MATQTGSKLTKLVCPLNPVAAGPCGILQMHAHVVHFRSSSLDSARGCSRVMQAATLILPPWHWSPPRARAGLKYCLWKASSWLSLILGFFTTGLALNLKPNPELTLLPSCLRLKSYSLLCA